MTFKRLAEYFHKLENTTLRNQMTEILAELFKEAPQNEIGKIVYLLQGRVAPLYEAVEFGLADKMIIRAIADGLKVDSQKVTRVFKESGDLGKTAEKLKANVKTKHNLNVLQVFGTLHKTALAGGEGSQDVKIKLLGSLIRDLDSLSVRYLVRIPVAKLRLGFSDMTILDALSWMKAGSKKLRPQFEKAYNVRPDLGLIAETVKRHKENNFNIEPRVGIPILMARAERMGSGEEIIDKIGRCAVEPKYDGFRLQGHKMGNKVELFSRNLENVTHMYPDIVQGIKKQVKTKEAIIEGEAVAYNPQTGEYLPFQETVQRKRKYNIEAKAKEIPLKLFAFELLYQTGKNLIMSEYVERRKQLEKIVARGEVILIAQEEVIDTPKRLEAIFLDTVSRGLEGVMAKKLDGIYRAGSRDFNWIKYKRSYAGKLDDTVDAVVMGYDFGQGKRTAFGIGDFLIGVFDEKLEKYVSIAKIGTGLTDEEWKEIKIRSEKLKAPEKPKNYEVDKIMGCDVWITPKIVVEIRADEITRSPVHTAGRIMGPTKTGSAIEVKEAGLALRFPRLERFRDDKNPTDATTLGELKKMLHRQMKK
ncbi:MAG: ATP-dependent DNA ligase I, DNA ligase 1 [Candidatus Gottesmanbacteria bacterium GW2011_GWA2_43_14]|uniref:Probable DNA ligase n=1 Tax=Candidatus Gottesmanbacteria bacterium GW2011_GWA2_43_14 TaxID=1618443 RepID=A0A0G1DK53_9BACT|nr:MAG: ATP-dependent DNA ligase I, DNA ligase 1 [Candidatus Gottesmanbacteria bacterium GW2011_GWA2_43_14]